MLCLPRFPLPTPRFLRCVWRAVLSGCPLCSLAGTPFHAVCAYCGLGPVALLVLPACPLCVCAPPRVGVACAPRADPVLGAGRAVPHSLCPSACPASVPFSVWLAWRGEARSRFPPTWLGTAHSPWGGCGRGDPSPTLPRSFLRAGFARCGGGMRLPRGGASSLGVGRPEWGALPAPTFFRGCCPGPLPTGCGCGGRRRGDLSPAPQRALL